MFPQNMLMPPGGADLKSILPELVLMGLGCLLLAWEMVRPRDRVAPAWIAIVGHVGALAALAPSYQMVTEKGFLASAEDALVFFHGNVVLDGFGIAMKAVVIVGSLLSLLVAVKYSERFRNPAEFFALVAFAASAASLLTVSADLVMIYLNVEFLGLTSYILAGYLKFQPRSTEAALKYFLYGAVTAAIMLYGMSFLYGMTGSTNLYAVPGEDIRTPLGPALLALREAPGGAAVILVSLALILVGLGFKTGLAPWHQWVPDVYDGSPLPVMAWLSVASKAGASAVIFRVLLAGIPAEAWVGPVAGIAALTMTAGNLGALMQTNIKRMLAYSSVAHAGYTMMALAAAGAGVFQPAGAGTSGVSVWQLGGVPVYLSTYVFMNIGALAVVTAVYARFKSHNLADYAGLVRRSPGLAWLMVFFMLSLAGIPPTAGFWGKFVLFAAVLQAGPQLVWLAIVAFINSVISVYYYWQVVRAMFLLEPISDEVVTPGPELRFTIALATAGTLAIFILAGPFMTLFRIH